MGCRKMRVRGKSRRTSEGGNTRVSALYLANREGFKVKVSKIRTK